MTAFDKALEAAHQIKIYGPWPELTSRIFNHWREMINGH